MTRRRLVVVVVLLVGATLAGAGPPLWRWWTAPPAGYCPICLRREHRESVVKIQASGEGATEACCMSCALTYGRQTSKAVTITSVTEHESGRDLEPERSVFVVGSDVSPCTHAMMHVGAEGKASPVRWDRCLPSVLAFSTEESAEAFRAQHGGRLRSLAQLKQEAGIAPAPAG